MPRPFKFTVKQRQETIRAPICIAGVFLQLRSTQSHFGSWLGVSAQPRAPGGWFECKSEPEGAGNGIFLSREGAEGTSWARSYPCKGLEPSPGCGMGQQGWAAAAVCLPQLFVSHKRWTFPGMLRAVQGGFSSWKGLWFLSSAMGAKNSTKPNQPPTWAKQTKGTL